VQTPFSKVPSFSGRGWRYDVLPTICSLLEIPILGDREIDGVDLSPLFRGGKLLREEPLFWAFETRSGDDPEGYMYSVRDGKWKLITDESFSKILLYDLENDPYETIDISQKRPKVVQNLISFIRDKKTSIENDPLRPKEGEDIQEVTILYTNDIESVYDPIDAYWNDTLNKIGGMAQLATLIQETRKGEELSFLFDAGDIFTGALSSVTYGALPFDIYSTMGYECMTLGNHEFEYSWQKLLDSKQRARFPILNANIFYKGTDIPYAQDYTILEKDGLRIGLIGIMGVEAFINTINPFHVEELEVRDPTPIVQKLVNKLRPEVDMIVVLTHQNKSAPMQSDKEVDSSVQRGFDEDYAMSGAVKGIDVILGGHSDNGLWEPVRHPETGTLIGITFGQGKYLGYMKLAVDKKQKKVSLKEGKLIPVISDKLQPHPDIKFLIEKAREENSQLTRVIGSNLSTGFRKYNAESNLGNFMADAIKEGSGSDIGLVNPGSIRADLDIGEITVEEIKNIYPFIDQLQVVSVSGKALGELIEYSASLTYGLAQFSGLEIIYDFSKPIGKRMVEAKVNGEKISDKETYTIACSGFLARGGDGYRWLKEGNSVQRKPQKLIDILISYVEERKEIQLPEVGRYKFLK
ncbi:MAG: 5'-nucleotidase C-terminal domain-containing protein, partial [Bacteroidota bacterium]